MVIMEDEFDWLSLDESEEVLWKGNPKIQRILGIKITDYVVTNRGLYRKAGLFSRSVKKVDFNKVQNISFSQGILGKKFGYGNVEISTAGSSGIEMMYAGIENPKNVQEMINKRIKQDTVEETSDGDASEIELLEDILKEIKEINEKL